MTTPAAVLPARTRIGAEHGKRDLAAAEEAATQFLVALGVDLAAPAMQDTPGRMARAYRDLFTPREFDFTTFANDEGYEQLVIQLNIQFQSVCEHHALPFTGTADVGYLPGNRIVGLSKLARVVELFARRPQVQERLTMQIADLLTDQLQPKGVGVVVRGEHMCMTLRGAQSPGTTTVTSALRGLLLNDARTREEFLALTRGGSR